MDVLITMGGAPYIEDGAVYVPFVAIGHVAGYPPLRLSFRVAYQWGATLAQKRTAILNAAAQARDAYEAAHGQNLPAVDRLEVLGI